MDSGNIHIEESKKPGFTFSIELRTNSKSFRVISWSSGLVRSPDKLKSLYLHYHSAYMATKLGRMVAYLDGLHPMKSHDSLITWSCKITEKT